MKLGLGSFAYAWSIGVPGHPPQQPLGALAFLAEARRLGVKVVQVCDNLPLARLPSHTLNEFEQAANAAGIQVEIGTRGIDPTHLLQHLELAQRFRSPILRVVIDSPGDEPSPAEVVSRLLPLGRAFREAGVRLAIENHDRFPAASLAWMVRQLGTGIAGVCLDTVNSFGALEGPDVVVETLAPYALSLHVKDFTIRRVPSAMGFEITGAAAGHGRLNLPWLFERLAKAGQDVNAILELWPPLQPTLEQTIALERGWVDASIPHLRQWIPD